MQTGIFRLVGFDEGGVTGTPDNLRLVCHTESHGKLVIWGKRDARRNIDAVLNAGLPCTIECDWRAPNPTHAKKFGHRYWVRQDFRLKVVG